MCGENCTRCVCGIKKLYKVCSFVSYPYNTRCPLFQKIKKINLCVAYVLAMSPSVSFALFSSLFRQIKYKICNISLTLHAFLPPPMYFFFHHSFGFFSPTSYIYSPVRQANAVRKVGVVFLGTFFFSPLLPTVCSLSWECSAAGQSKGNYDGIMPLTGQLWRREGTRECAACCGPTKSRKKSDLKSALIGYSHLFSFRETCTLCQHGQMTHFTAADLNTRFALHL